MINGRWINGGLSTDLRVHVSLRINGKSRKNSIFKRYIELPPIMKGDTDDLLNIRRKNLPIIISLMCDVV